MTEIRHPDADKIETALKAIPHTDKIIFDYRPGDGVYKTPENHLIILVFTDNDFDDPANPGFGWFANRRKWTETIYSTLEGLGWKHEDPSEENDRYLYLVIRRKAAK